MLLSNTKWVGGMLVLPALLIGAMGSDSLGKSLPGRRAWTIKDSIEMRWFSGNNESPQDWPREGGANYINVSPDEKYIYVVTHRGDLGRDLNVYEMAIFTVASLRQALAQPEDTTKNQVRPYMVVSETTTSSTQPAIRDAHWLRDSRGVSFLGTDSDSRLQVKLVDLEKREVSTLTACPDRIWNYTCELGAVVYGAAPSDQYEMPIRMLPPKYPARFLEWDSAQRVKLPIDEAARTVSTYVKKSGCEAIKLEGKFRNCVLVPKNDCALAVLWKIDEDSTPLSLFVAIDIRTGKVNPLLRGAVANKGPRLPIIIPQAISYGDGTHAILVNAAHPDRGCAFEGGAIQEGFVVDIDLRNQSTKVIEAFDDGSDKESSALGSGRGYISNVRLDDAGEKLMIYREHAGEVYETHYILRNGEWQKDAARLPGSKAMPDSNTVNIQRSMRFGSGLASGTRTASFGDVTVYVREDGNIPPAIIAEGLGRRIEVIAEDATLRELLWSPVQNVQWKESTGTKVQGGLWLPASKTSGALPPLVIQVSYYVPGYFLPDGNMSANFAAQTLVAAGFAVLQVDMITRVPPDQEGPRLVQRLDSIIDALSKRGVIDPTRVGVAGFSRAGFQIMYVLTHPGRNHIASAVCSDSFTGTYPEYLRYAPTGVREGYELLWGGPFWEHKEQWLKQEITFNMDHLRTPVLFAKHREDLSHSSDTLPTIAAFQLTAKPMDYIYLPFASHQLLRPKERKIELQATVDWMCFWLKGEIPSDPERAARWAVLRKQQDEVLKTPPPPKGKWVFVPEGNEHPDSASPAAGSGTSSEAGGQKKTEKTENTSSNPSPSKSTPATPENISVAEPKKESEPAPTPK